MSFEIVDRPNGGQLKSKYGEYYEPIRQTATEGNALRLNGGITRKEVSSIRIHFHAKYPGLRFRSSKLPDGFYVWAEPKA